MFISYHGGDVGEVRMFIARWVTGAAVFTPRILGEDVYAREGLVDSANPEYVMNQIRRRYIADASMTMLFIGTCTHSRRYVDWELKATLRRGEYTPNGLLAILLPSAQPSSGGAYPHLPERFHKNYSSTVRCYASYHLMPTTAEELDSWIEDAVAARISRAALIQNDADMMSYNARCLVHGVTH